MTVPSRFDDLHTFMVTRGVKWRDGIGFWEDSHDYGLYWKENGANHRLTWIGAAVPRENDETPGELYLVRLSPTQVTPIGTDALMITVGEDRGLVEFLGIIPPAHAPLASVFDREIGGRNDPAATVEQVLEGWAEVCGTPDSVEWVRARMRLAFEYELAIRP